ncbi:universal stress protein [Actinoallomurus purpureus]|uniref:universal stress protein n=1 Tax=Actinoallomurus purpureus TaxID=478114 RepID=UPI0020930D8A|nr:universal stress protein [Actinoallomurus purpureus]MCO6005416.1 universal stress protein [Actinoallomurus purpureus]
MAGIVVGVDGSADSDVALEWAVAEAERWKVPVTAITVAPRMVTIGAGAPMLGPVDQEMLQAMGEAARAAAEKAAVGHEVPINVRAIAGVPAEELLNASVDADMLVVGSRGHGGFARLLLGSVSSQCVHHAGCPVVVIPSRHRGRQRGPAGAEDPTPR